MHPAGQAVCCKPMVPPNSQTLCQCFFLPNINVKNDKLLTGISFLGYDVFMICLCFFHRHQFVENNLILKMGPVDKRKVSDIIIQFLITLINLNWDVKQTFTQVFT